MKKLLVGIFSTAILLSATMGTAQANTWQQPNGVWVSDTCRDNHGNWFKFFNKFGPINAPCQWIDQFGNHFFGHFG